MCRVQIWSREDRQSVLDLLTTSLLTDKNVTVKLASSLFVLLLELLGRAQRRAFNGDQVSDGHQHQQLCIALSKLAHLSPNVMRYVT